MTKTLSLNYNQITVIDFYSLYTDSIESYLLKDLKNYSCNPPEVDSTAQRLIMHHVIHGVCEHILKLNTKSKVIIFFCNNSIFNTEIYDAYNNKQLNKIFNKLCKVFKSKLPIRWYNSIYPLEYVKICLDDNKNDGIKIADDLLALSNNDFSKFLFDKIKIYSKKMELNFLDQVYFNQLRSKMIMVS